MPAGKPRPEKKRKKTSSRNDEKPTSRLKALRALRTAIQTFLDADEVINVNELNDRSSTIFHKKTFREKLSEFLKNTKSIKVKAEDAEATDYADDGTQGDLEQEAPAQAPQVADADISGYEDLRKGRARKGLSNLLPGVDHPSRERVPMEEVARVIEESAVETPRTEVVREEFRNDLRDVILITYRLIKKVPPEALKEFRESPDYRKYVAILDKYDLVRRKDGDQG